jgi:release factor glutamine methyltransferase
MTAVAPTLLDVLRRSTRYLGDHGSDSARLDAEVLCARSLGLRRLDLYLQFDRPLREDELAPIRALVRRRGLGEPVAYITGVREFFGREFTVTPAVLVPRPDTETLIERVLAWCRERDPAGSGMRIADIGTGSGCIAVTLAAELPGTHVVGVDVSRDALEVATANARRNGVAERVTLVPGSWCVPLAGMERFDVVVSNPPYVTAEEMTVLPRDVASFEPDLALRAGEEGLEPYRILATSVTPFLRTAGLVAVEIDPRRAAQVEGLFRDAMPAGDVVLSDDLSGRKRVCTVTIGH